MSDAKCDMSRTCAKKKKLKVSLLAEKGSEGWMTKEMGSGEERGGVRGREGEREREKVWCDFLCDRAPQQTWEE